MSLTEIKPGLLTKTEPAWRGWLSNNSRHQAQALGRLLHKGVGSCSCA